MAEVPNIHHWSAGDDMNAVRMNEIKAAIDFARNPPMVHVGRTLTSQSATVATNTLVSFDTLFNNYDPYDMWTSGTNVNITVPGWYTCEAVLSFTNNATSTKTSMTLLKNGAIIVRWDQQGLQNLSGNVNYHKESTIFLNVGDILTLAFNYDTGAARTLANTSNAESPQMRVRWIST